MYNKPTSISTLKLIFKQNFSDDSGRKSREGIDTYFGIFWWALNFIGRRYKRTRAPCYNGAENRYIPDQIIDCRDGHNRSF